MKRLKKHKLAIAAAMNALNGVSESLVSVPETFAMKRVYGRSPCWPTAHAWVFVRGKFGDFYRCRRCGQTSWGLSNRSEDRYNAG